MNCPAVYIRHPAVYSRYSLNPLIFATHTMHVTAENTEVFGELQAQARFSLQFVDPSAPYRRRKKMNPDIYILLSRRGREDSYALGEAGRLQDEPQAEQRQTKVGGPVCARVSGW